MLSIFVVNAHQRPDHGTVLTFTQIERNLLLTGTIYIDKADLLYYWDPSPCTSPGELIELLSEESMAPGILAQAISDKLTTPK